MQLSGVPFGWGQAYRFPLCLPSHLLTQFATMLAATDTKNSTTKSIGFTSFPIKRDEVENGKAIVPKFDNLRKENAKPLNKQPARRCACAGRIFIQVFR